MTTKSPLIRRVGSGYAASGNGFYLYDEDLRRVLARAAELTTAGSEERFCKAEDLDSAGDERVPSE